MMLLLTLFLHWPFLPTPRVRLPVPIIVVQGGPSKTWGRR